MGHSNQGETTQKCRIDVYVGKKKKKKKDKNVEIQKDREGQENKKERKKSSISDGAALCSQVFSVEKQETGLRWENT